MKDYYKRLIKNSRINKIILYYIVNYFNIITKSRSAEDFCDSVIIDNIRIAITRFIKGFINLISFGNNDFSKK